jgi:class 3 adenylate cyclase
VAQNSPDRLRALLLSLGATEAEVDAVGGESRGGDFAAELALRTGPPLTVAAAADRAGMSIEDYIRFWHALGLPTPAADEAAVPAELVSALPVVAQAIQEWLGEDSALGIARVLGSASARLAESLVDAFRLGFEVPRLSAGTSYAEVVEQYVDLLRGSLPPFLDLFAAVFKTHLVQVAYGAWSPDAESVATSRHLMVGFVDLVGYTALARTLSPGELAGLLSRFEDLVADVVTTGGGRLVKLIGDGAMFVADTPDDGCRMALGLCDRLASTEALPPARVGADSGVVLARQGDYFGEVVNRAARLVALANPATVVVSESIAAALDGNSFGLERLPPQALKGFQAPAVTYRLLPR